MIKEKIKHFFRHDWLRIIYYNFKYLPLNQAIHLPIDISYKTVIRKCKKITINSNKINRSMLSIGFQSSDIFSLKPTIIDNQGSLEINGNNVIIGTGTTIKIAKNAIVSIADGTCIGANSLIVCEKSITIQENAIFSWNCQIMDTDTHSLQNIVTKEIYQRYKTINIGKNTWIGNHVVINKGTIIPEGTIISSMSLCNKDYTSLIKPYSVIGGIPAKLITSNRTKINDKL